MNGALAGTSVPNFTVPELSGALPQPQAPADPNGPGGPGGQPGGQNGTGGFLGGLIGGGNP
jgi:hypothetical protein